MWKQTDLKRRKTNTVNRRRNRILAPFLCLLVMGVMLSLCAGTGYCASDIQGLNASGNRNIEPSVDPFGKNEGFSAVLYNNKNGLPTSEANAIAQSSDGFLWIGSYAGLVRYDGNTFERLDSSTGIANVRCLYTDSKDRLWIGTNDSGVYLMIKDEFRKWGRKDGLKSVSIRSIAEDSRGVIYLSTAGEGIAMIGRDMKLSVLQDERLTGQLVEEIRLGSDGLIYGRTDTEDLFTMKNGEVVTFISHEDCPVKGIRSILPDPEHPGNLYVGTGYSRVYYGSLEESFTVMRETDVSPLTRVDTIEYIGEKIWLGARNGIAVLDGGVMRILENIPMNSSITQIMTDLDGNLWFASTRQGVMKIVPSRFFDLFVRYDLPPAVVNSTCMQDGRLFIGTDTGLIVVDSAGTVDSIPLTKAVTASGSELDANDLLAFLENARIRSIIQDSKGRLWISTSLSHGLIRYDQGEMTVFTMEDGLFSDEIRTVYECEDGSILVAHNNGMNIIRGDAVTAGYGKEDGLHNLSILSLTEGFDHSLVLGSDGGGIYVISPDGLKHIGEDEGLSSEVVLRIKRSTSRDLYWIITGNSLAVMTPDYQVKTLGQFPYPNNYDLYENSRGDVWVLSSAGIFVDSAENLLSDEELHPVTFGISSGMPYMPTVNSFSALTPEGTLYIAGGEGVIKLDIESSIESISDLQLTIPYVDADGERYYPDASGVFTLPGTVRKLTVYPHVLNYALIDPQVSYRLEGFDAETVTVSRSKLTPVDYTNLGVGTYRFILTASDPVTRTQQTASFTIAKGKELSKTTAVTIILDLLALFIIGGTVVYRSLYPKRGRTRDWLFLGMVMTVAVMAAAEIAASLLTNSTVSYARPLIIAGYTVTFILRVCFAYLLFIYLDPTADPDTPRARKAILMAGIPYFVFCVLMIINLWTGWVFSVDEGNTYLPGLLEKVYLLPVSFYLLCSLARALRTSRRLAFIGILLILFRILFGIWRSEISPAAFLYTLILVNILSFLINGLLTEERT